uniref:Uncharacterized protein n=1 Tax=Oryza glumipatula TaxID=40148 RepID=A0A0E0A770_9ORYZ
MVTVAGYMYTVRFGGLIRSETFVPPSSPSSQKLLSNPNPSPLPTRSRRRRHRHRLPLELVKPEPPPSSQARGASRRRRRAEPVVTVAVFPSTSCESGVPLSPPFPSPSPSHADFGSCKICARIEPPQARGLQIFLEAQTKGSRCIRQAKSIWAVMAHFLGKGFMSSTAKSSLSVHIPVASGNTLVPTSFPNLNLLQTRALAGVSSPCMIHVRV